jgi:hypothetical protein
MNSRGPVTHPDRELIALGIRQPWAELILRGIKTIEVRSLTTRVRGPIYLYTSQKLADIPAAREALSKHRLNAASLQLGLIVGTVDIVECRPCTPADADAACVPAELLRGRYAWRLANPVRLEIPLKPRFLPYGVWFYPFRRRNAGQPRRRRGSGSTGATRG